MKLSRQIFAPDGVVTPRKPRQKRENPEAAIQRAIVKYLRTILPDALVHHSDNAVRRSGEDGRINRMVNAGLGVVTGWPDLTVCLRSGRVLFFEVKAPGGSTSVAQEHVGKKLGEMGHGWAVVRSVDEVRAELAGWKIETRERGIG